MAVSSDQTRGPIVVLCKTKMDSLIPVQSYHSDPDPEAGSLSLAKIMVLILNKTQNAVRMSVKNMI